MDKIIVMFEENDREIYCSLYDYVESLFYANISFLVCHVTEEEYNEMKKEIKSGFLDERLTRILEGDLKYNRLRYFMKNDDKLNNISIADYNDFLKIGNYTWDENGIRYNKDKKQFPNDMLVSPRRRNLKIYTTETYDDVISYYLNKNDNLLDTKKLNLKK